MRVLYLDNAQLVAASSCLYEGLHRVLGGDAVVEFPFRAPLHGGSHDILLEENYGPLYAVARGEDPLPAGIPPFALGEPLTGGDAHLFGPGDIPCAVPNKHEERRTWDQMVAAVPEFDFIVLASSHRIPTITLALLRDRLGGKLPPVVYLDGGERDDFNAHWWHVFRPALCFKQILTPAVRDAPRSPANPCPLWPLPLANQFLGAEDHFGYSWTVSQFITTLARLIDEPPPGGANLRRGPCPDRHVDVVYPHGISWDGREAVLRAFRDEVAATGAWGVEKTFNWGPPYFLAAFRSRMALSIRGSGRDSLRYWELPAFGPLLLADGTMGAIHPHPFRDGDTAAFWSSLDELRSKFRYYLSHEDERARVAARGTDHLRRFHTAEARALFFLAVVRRELGVDYSVEQRGRVAARLDNLGWGSPLPDWEGPVVGYEPG